MNLDDLHQRFEAGDIAAVRQYQPTTAHEAWYATVLHYASGDIAGALAAAQTARQLAPNRLLPAAAATYLATVAANGTWQVYHQPEAFVAFIRGGGNVPLYEAVQAALRDVYSGYSSATLLDIGVGDGLALLPALNDGIAAVTLVEPASEMLARTVAALSERGVAHTAHNQPLEQFAEHASDRWDIAQATFSFQSVPMAERGRLLRWVRQHAGRLLLVEFDIPLFASPFAPAYVDSVIERFETGLAEYTDNRDLVAQGFLLPVMFGYFDRGADRTNHEIPLRDWVALLREAGFTEISERRLYDYWWSPAVLLDAR